MAWQGTRGKQLPKNWATIRKRILRRDPTCSICRARPSVEVDHIQRGDNHHPSNLRGVCAPCHQRKSSQEGARAKAARYNQLKYRKPAKHPGEL